MENYNFIQKLFSEDFIYKKTLKNIYSTNSTELDDILARFIKDEAHIIFINLIITSNILPDDLKVARIKPLYKKLVHLMLEIIDWSVY